MDLVQESLTRRAFVRRMSAGAAFLAAHGALAGVASGTMSRGARRPMPFERAGDEPLIRGVELLTGAPLAAMRAFYHEKIGFAVVEETDDRLGFDVGGGASRLTFVRAKPGDVHGDAGRGAGEPMYHFAFNIPHNAVRAARDWQAARSALIEPRAGLRDPAYPPEVWHFRHWDAHSVFFFDPAFNIVEYIGRHGLHNDAADPAVFAAGDVQCISEIGFVVDDAAPHAAMLREKLGLTEYPRGSTPWAIGDERGLLLCLPRKGQMWGEQSATPVKWGVFPTRASIRGAGTATVPFDGFPYQVSVEP